MKDPLAALFEKHRGRGVLVDANVLLALFLGRIDPARVWQTKRTASYSREDLQFVEALVQSCGRIVVTPNILTEVSNLAGIALKGRLKDQFFDRLGREVTLVEENYVASSVTTVEPCFGKLGLTDAGVSKLAREALLVLTDDFPLAGTLQKAGAEVINLNHVRQSMWFGPS